MAVARANSGIPLDMEQFRAADIRGGTVASADASLIRVTFGTDGILDLIGSNFTYDAAGVPTGGSLERIDAFTAASGGTPAVTVTNLAVPLVDFFTAATQGDTTSAMNALFGETDDIAGSTLGDRLIGFAGNDILDGLDGDDVLDPRAGSDAVTGGGGFDVARFSGRSTDYAFTYEPDRVNVSGPDGADVLAGVERLAFSDRSLLGVVPSFQAVQIDLAAQSGGNTFQVRQVPVDPVQDPGAEGFATRIQLGGQDIQGVRPTLRDGWDLGAVADTDGDGADEVFLYTVADGFGVTWELDGSGMVAATGTHLSMGRQGWEVAGAADLNGLAGEEIVWQDTLTGEKAIWTDANADGVMEGSFILPELGQDLRQRIVGVSDLDRDGLQELMRYDDGSGALSVLEASPGEGGAVAVSLLRDFASFAEFETASNAEGAPFTTFDFYV